MVTSHQVSSNERQSPTSVSPRPIVRALGLDPRKLPAEVFGRLATRAGYIADRAQREEEAWRNFGKPGRDPHTLGGVLDVLAKEGSWTTNLELAQLRSHWDQVVGAAIAQHSKVIGCAEGVLTISTASPAWTTQLTFMVPQLTATIRERLKDLDIQEIRVTGPRAHGWQRRMRR